MNTKTRDRNQIGRDIKSIGDQLQTAERMRKAGSLTRAEFSGAVRNLRAKLERLREEAARADELAKRVRAATRERLERLRKQVRAREVEVR